jgi:hypothetical protein
VVTYFESTSPILKKSNQLIDFFFQNRFFFSPVKKSAGVVLRSHSKGMLKEALSQRR